KYTGISTEEKISYMTKFCADNKLDAYLITECDSVSWLMNLRSDLIKDTPVLRAYALVSATGEVSLYTNDFVTLENELDAYKNKTIGVTFNRTPKKLQTLLKSSHIWIRNLNNPIIDWKAEKNPVEISGFKSCHIRDAAAVIKFMHWLDTNWQTTDELGVVNKLHEFRKEQDNFYSNSFETIAGFGPNGAIIHYQPTPETNKKLESDSILLLDSGAQYFDGTTDITRTIALGAPSAEIINSYTQVLKSHIAVSSAIFPLETPGTALDTLARAALWKFGKDYAHGTGHGVGHFLSVHEGPQSISNKNMVSLKKGMITSIEPGFYKEGAYGIRLENLALVKETTTDFMSPMLCFEPLTLVPFDLRLINKALLTQEELNWINAYHQKVYDTVSPLLKSETATWLKQKTLPL
ncbi:MAG: aminopeptidase P family protein, partial [Alphaproteobacteria bacterium]|nr:aminopeptidase P family protein [Alphaproteobacteria bacterium]